jgi:hypothetical protein
MLVELFVGYYTIATGALIFLAVDAYYDGKIIERLTHKEPDNQGWVLLE